MTSSAIHVFGGRLFDARWETPRAGGVLIACGRIVAVGPDRRLADAAPAGALRLDAGGGLITPGLHDVHAHMSEGGVARLGVDGRGARSVQELGERAASRAASLPAGEWVTGRGWDDRTFGAPRWPDRHDLDRACPDHPVLLRRVCGHVAVASTSALRAAGIGSAAPDPDGGRIERSAEGVATGRLFETAVALVLRAIPAPSFARRCAGLRYSLAQARQYGITSAADERGWPDVYRELAARGELTCRLRMWARLTDPLDELIAWREAFPRGPHAQPGLLKAYLDGSLGSRTALFREPYADAPDTCGVATLDPARFAELAAAADREGFQVGVHAIGDAAVERALDAFAEVARLRGSGGSDTHLGRRHRIEHAQHLLPGAAERFAALGVVASMQPSHLASDRGMVEPRVGRDRLAGAYPWRSLLRAGASVAFGSDYPIESIDPRTSLYAAVTRRGYDGAGPLAPVSEAITLREALAGFTSGAAYAAFAEHERGHIEPGYVGDLTVFAQDLFALPPDQLLTAPLRATVVGGRVVWEARAEA